MKNMNELIKEISQLESKLHDKDFLLTWEQSPEELERVLKNCTSTKNHAW